ncbi:MAG: tryptophan-rich sensory protein [Crocinitomicaceae bacterium]|jgi:translocator protein|nr:tryptophan-rich sensory protein [Crocinitomicaceae bacterium]
MALKSILFLGINFAALLVGSLFTKDGVSSEWYQSLEKAPWDPPGWMFGVAWTLIMVLFSVYMAKLFQTSKNKKQIILLFIAQWVLNVIWNPIFFYYQSPLLSLIVIIALTLLIGSFICSYLGSTKYYTLLVLPYFLWLIVATSLNNFILYAN